MTREPSDGAVVIGLMFSIAFVVHGAVTAAMMFPGDDGSDPLPFTEAVVEAGTMVWGVLLGVVVIFIGGLIVLVIVAATVDYVRFDLLGDVKGWFDE